MNPTLQTILAKYYQETHTPWVDLLPMALLKVRTSPGPTRYTPFDMVQGALCQLENITFQEQLIQLGKIFSQIHENITERAPLSTDTPAHTYSPGTCSWLKIGKSIPYLLDGGAHT